MPTIFLSTVVCILHVLKSRSRHCYNDYLISKVTKNSSYMQIPRPTWQFLVLLYYVEQSNIRVYTAQPVVFDLEHHKNSFNLLMKIIQTERVKPIILALKICNFVLQN